MGLHPTRLRMVRSGFFKRPQVKTSLNYTAPKKHKMGPRTVKNLFIIADEQTITLNIVVARLY